MFHLCKWCEFFMYGMECGWMYMHMENIFIVIISIYIKLSIIFSIYIITYKLDVLKEMVCLWKREFMSVQQEA